MIRRQPRATRTDTLFPGTSSFRLHMLGARRIEKFEFEKVAEAVDLRPEGGGRIAAVTVAQLEQRKLDHRAVEEMMRDDVAVIARHRMPGGIDRIDIFAAGFVEVGRASCRERVCTYV